VRILVTNDDGYEARGIAALVADLVRWSEEAPPGEEREVIVVAPNTNYSGAACAVGEVYSRSELAYKRVELPGAETVEAYALDASPALCTIVGCLGGLGEPPDLVVSGVNHGVNVGRSVLYSGTVGAILAAGQLGLSGLAVSMQSRKDAPVDAAARLAVAVLEQLVAAPPRTLLSLNVPALELSAIKGLRRGRISQAGLIKATGALAISSFGPLRVGDSGALALTLGSAVPALGDVSDEEPDDDGALIAAGYASLTALRGVHEDTDDGPDDLVRASVAAVEADLGFTR
jgi:5'-nucleotidase